MTGCARPPLPGRQTATCLKGPCLSCKTGQPGGLKPARVSMQMTNHQAQGVPCPVSYNLGRRIAHAPCVRIKVWKWWRQSDMYCLWPGMHCRKFIIPPSALLKAGRTFGLTGMLQA